LLDHLSYSVTFPSTARTLKGDVDFKTGFGTITGANESGKSFIIEVARWCLFGTAALRGRADDYKTLKATLQFQVKGDSYEVRRTHNSVKLTKGDTLVATGTKPVNEHILGLLGFGLEVFDVACAANQGDVEKLSAMKPAERKRMVDQVIGLDRIEELAKWCGDEAKMFERQVVDPGSEPTAPAEEWDEALLKRAQAAFEEMHQIRGLLSVSRRPPVEPTTTVTATAEYWKGLADQERELRAELKMLQIRLRALPKPSQYTDEELDKIEWNLDAFKLWQRKQAFEQRYPRSTWHRQQLLVMRDDWTVVEQAGDLHRLVEELRSHGEVDCPNCQHHFYLESGRLDELERKLDELDKIKAPPLSRREIAAELAKLDDWERMDTQAEWGQLKDVQPAEQPQELSDAYLQQCRRANAAAAERSQIEVRILELGDIPDHEPQYMARVRYEADYQAYLKDKVEHAAWVEERNQAENRATIIKPLADRFPELGLLKIEWARYRDLKAIWDDTSTKALALAGEADGWRAAQTALNKLRVMAKSHLVPALSRVASGLVAQMTGGQRNWITVDEDFDVLVDGQRLDTLSGSGKAVANLALRIGLGQVLTNNVLSVFIGDEIDASMDDTRAENLGECIVTLVNRISQIILITHKSQVDADWCVNLGNGEWMAGSA
jgi:DNA repair protein SbcC/Rad50